MTLAVVPARTCSRCAGPMFPDSDQFGAFLACLHCGNYVDVNSRTGAKLEDLPVIDQVAPTARRPRLGGNQR